MSGLGCTPAEQKGSLPPSLPPSVFVIGEIRQKFDARPSIQARKIQRHPTPPSCAAWVGFTWQDSPLLRKAFPLVLSWGHWLGVRAWGPGCPNQTRTLHRHQENASSAHPCWVAQLKICSLACGAMPVTEGITPTRSWRKKSVSKLLPTPGMYACADSRGSNNNQPTRLANAPSSHQFSAVSLKGTCCSERPCSRHCPHNVWRCGETRPQPFAPKRYAFVRVWFSRRET